MTTTATATVLLATVLLTGGTFWLGDGGPSRVTEPAAVESSPRPTAAGPTRPGHYAWPLHPRPTVLRGFVVGPHRWSPGHRGVDLAADGEQEVLAPAEGVVSFSGVVAGRATLVIRHIDDVRTTYQPVAGTVPRGAAVSLGQPVGRIVADRPHCARVCLHWGALRGGEYLDPLSLLLRRRAPILLPLPTTPARRWPPTWSAV